MFMTVICSDYMYNIVDIILSIYNIDSIYYVAIENEYNI